MIRFIIIRLLQAIPVLLIISTLTFFMIRIAPGGPFTEEKAIPEEIKKKIEEYYGLDKSLWKQYLIYFGLSKKKYDSERIVFQPQQEYYSHISTSEDTEVIVDHNGKIINGHELNHNWVTERESSKLNKNNFLIYIYERSGLLFGDFGPSYKYVGWDVKDLILTSFPVSFQLGMFSLIIALTIGIPSGVFAAINKNSLFDYIPMSLAMLGICLPTFVMGPILLLIFSSFLGMFNPIGWYHWSDMVLPSLTLGLYYAAYIARLTRGGMLEILNEDFIVTARAKGLPKYKIIIKHALRGGLLPVIAFLGPAFAGLISGSFVIETIFSIPGLGKYFVTAAFNRDYTMVMGTVLFYASLIILMNLIVDILLAWLNPRIRLTD